VLEGIATGRNVAEVQDGRVPDHLRHDRQVASGERRGTSFEKLEKLRVANERRLHCFGGAAAPVAIGQR